MIVLPLSRYLRQSRLRQPFSFTILTGAAGKKLLSKNDVLKKDDEKDTKLDLKNSPRKVYPIKLEAGKAYQIDLKSADFDAFLRLEDAKGKEVAYNDDDPAGSTTDSHITTVLPASGSLKHFVAFDRACTERCRVALRSRR